MRTQDEERIERRIRALFDVVADDTESDAPPIYFLHHAVTGEPSSTTTGKIRHRWAFAAAFLLVALTAGVAVLTSAHRSDGPATPGTSISGAPPTTKLKLSTPSGELTLRLPKGWGKTPPPVGTTPDALVAVGTNPKRPPINDDQSKPPIGTWLIIYDVTKFVNKDALASTPSDDEGSGQHAIPILEPPAQQMAAYAHDRPADFLDPYFMNASINWGTTAQGGDRYFRDAGRIFDARIVTTKPPAGRPDPNVTVNRETKKSLAILNSLQIKGSATAQATP